jgi:predicted Fe-Mo cluster-binding NifX family protein
MKIAVSSTGIGPDATVDPRFGRCAYFAYVDPETMAIEAEPNEAASAGGGAGIAAAQQLAAKEPEAVLTGHCGPNAFDVLKAAGIKVFTNVAGSVREAVEAYKTGTLQPVSQPDTAAHTGMGRSGGMGRGRGRGWR